MADILKTVSTINQGRMEDRMSNIEADQLRRQAVADKAQSIQVAKEERKKADLLQSRATAVAAASGSSTGSPDIQNTLAAIGQRGEYNSLAALYSGFSAARSKQYAADMRRAEGKNRRLQGYLRGASTILGSAEDLSQSSFGNYG